MPGQSRDLADHRQGGLGRHPERARAPADIVKSVNREYVNNMGGRFRPKAQLLDRTFTIFTQMRALAATLDHVAAGKPAVVGTLNSDEQPMRRC